MPTPDEYVQQIEAAVDDEDALRILQVTLIEAPESELNDQDRDFLLGRVDRYLYDFTKARDAAWRSSANDEIMAGRLDPEIGESP